jgi:hypothetical protein
MKWFWMAAPILAWGVLILGSHAGGAAEPAQQKVLAGWLGVFPELTSYQRSFLAPVVDNKQVYRQTAKYLWTGGAMKLLEVTVARDAAFKKQYDPAALKKQKNPPQEVKVGKKTAWLWDLSKEAGDNADKVRARLVVPLGDDKILMLEAKGRGPWEQLTGLAERFNAAAIEKALGTPPRTDFKRQLEPFQALRKGMPYSDVVPWVGLADKDVGSGIHVLVYDLPDGSKVLLGFPDFQRMLYAKYQDKNGKTSDLAN